NHCAGKRSASKDVRSVWKGGKTVKSYLSLPFPKFLLNQKAIDHRIASMDAQIDILQQVHQAAAVKILFLPHAVQQMARPERMISTVEVRQVIDTGERIEDYPADPRGHSCLLLGPGNERRPIHVVCAPKAEYLA